MRRDGADIELRLVEALGQPGTAEVKVNLPHSGVALTDLTGSRAIKLQGGPSYLFPVKPQQIVTIRLRTEKPVAEVQPLIDWSPLLVPPHKQAARPANTFQPRSVIRRAEINQMAPSLHSFVYAAPIHIPPKCPVKLTEIPQFRGIGHSVRDGKSAQHGFQL